MFMILKRNWEALDASKPPGDNTAIIPAGRHEVERIPNPYGHNGYWLVLKETLIGGSEGSWQQWRNSELVTDEKHPNFGKPIDWGTWEVVIEE
jgi:hypothetical protein